MAALPMLCTLLLWLVPSGFTLHVADPAEMMPNQPSDSDSDSDSDSYSPGTPFLQPHEQAGSDQLGTPLFPGARGMGFVNLGHDEKEQEPPIKSAEEVDEEVAAAEKKEKNVVKPVGNGSEPWVAKDKPLVFPKPSPSVKPDGPQVGPDGRLCGPMIKLASDWELKFQEQMGGFNATGELTGVTYKPFFPQHELPFFADEDKQKMGVETQVYNGSFTKQYIDDHAKNDAGIEDRREIVKHNTQLQFHILEAQYLPAALFKHQDRARKPYCKFTIPTVYPHGDVRNYMTAKVMPKELVSTTAPTSNWTINRWTTPQTINAFFMESFNQTVTSYGQFEMRFDCFAAGANASEPDELVATTELINMKELTDLKFDSTVTFDKWFKLKFPTPANTSEGCFDDPDWRDRYNFNCRDYAEDVHWCDYRASTGVQEACPVTCGKCNASSAGSLHVVITAHDFAGRNISHYEWVDICACTNIVDYGPLGGINHTLYGSINTLKNGILPYGYDCSFPWDLCGPGLSEPYCAVKPQLGGVEKGGKKGAWCFDHWCWVSPDCPTGSPSNYFLGSPLVYSYGHCTKLARKKLELTGSKKQKKSKKRKRQKNPCEEQEKASEQAHKAKLKEQEARKAASLRTGSAKDFGKKKKTGGDNEHQWEIDVSMF